MQKVKFVSVCDGERHKAKALYNARTGEITFQAKVDLVAFGLEDADLEEAFIEFPDGTKVKVDTERYSNTQKVYAFREEDEPIREALVTLFQFVGASAKDIEVFKAISAEEDALPEKRFRLLDYALAAKKLGVCGPILERMNLTQDQFDKIVDLVKAAHE